MQILIKGENMIIKKLFETPVMETAHNVDARNLYNKETAMVTVITLKPGQSLKPHITPVDVAFYVLKGKGIVEIGDEKKEVEENSLIESPKDIKHCLYNNGTEDFMFMVIKAPRPTKKTIFIA
jgi:quercetin dioxygenase-like cupin family protein